jgi:hypothetical protein
LVLICFDVIGCLVLVFLGEPKKLFSLAFQLLFAFETLLVFGPVTNNQVASLVFILRVRLLFVLGVALLKHDIGEMAVVLPEVAKECVVSCSVLAEYLEHVLLVGTDCREVSVTGCHL